MTTVADLVSSPCPWLASPGSDGGVVVSSRIRLARTWTTYAFHRKLSRKRQQELTDRLTIQVEEVFPQVTAQWQLQHLLELERLALVERQAVSRDHAAAKRPGGVVLGSSGSGTSGSGTSGSVHLAAMINEEDHLRLQAIGSGLCLPQLLAAAVAVDRALEQQVTWATHPSWGYLTACHTNLGTGLRASVMLHLPALTETGELKAVLRALGKLHLAVRGQHGEGSEAAGHTYQISNARTLGQTEEAYVAAITDAVERVVAAERIARAALLEKAANRLEDKVFRAWGVLTQARSLSTEELVDQLSWVRLGTALHVLTDRDWAIPTGSPERWRMLDRIALHALPAHLQLLHGGGQELAPGDRDRLRATLVRGWLTHKP